MLGCDGMRDWQVGDSIGDGNDAGVPDVPYMGYLREESSEENMLDEFRTYFNNAWDFAGKEDDFAFYSLYSAFECYGKLNEFQKSQIGEKPFNRDRLIGLCCRMINEHGKNYRKAEDIIIKHRLRVKLCMDCDCMYTRDHDHCERCGKPLEDPFIRTPEDIAAQIPEILRRRLIDEATIERIVSRSLKLMKSNGSRLVSIERGFDFDIDFVFEKEHRYFTTRYECAFDRLYEGPQPFRDFAIKHDYTRLLDDGSFRKMISDKEDETGFTFRGCSGGYGAQLDDTRYDFIFNDEINLTVDFDMGDGRTAVYGVDLDRMQLSEDYRVYY